MKISLLISLVVLALAPAAFSQGTIEWSGINPTYFTAETNTTASTSMFWGGTFPGGSIGLTTTTAGAFYYELLYNTDGTPAPTTLVALQSWFDTGLEAKNSVNSAGNATTINGSVDATVPFTTSENFMLVGWSANLGSTWSAAEINLESPGFPGWTGTAFFGESAVATITPGPGFGPGAILFGPTEIDSPATQLYGIYPIPEPTTLALSALGGVALLAFRRRKA